MTLVITTNNVPRDVINSWELTAAEREQFDYLDWEAIDDGRGSAEFFRFNGQLYDLGDMERGWNGMPDGLKGWHNYLSDSFFSGIVIRYPYLDDYGLTNDFDYEHVIVGWYYVKD